jgi:nucleoside-diphosphate-sugar epimerase
MLIHDMICRVRDEREIFLAGGIGLYLTPTYVEDVVRIFYYLKNNPLPDHVNVFNIAGDEVLSLADIASEIGRQLNKPPVFKITNGPVLSFCGDNTRIKKIYNDFTPFTLGIQKNLQYILYK